MGRMRGWLALTVVAATGAGIVLLPPERARADAPAVADAPTVSSLANMRDGFKWGITHSDVITAFNKQGGLWDQEYDPQLRKAQPGVQQQAIEADRDNKKAALERSYVRFVTPTGYDSTDLNREYTYKNNEALCEVERQGKKRYFFFIGAEPNERLWKIYDEIPLTASGPMGATFAEAVNRVQGVIGVVGRVRAADPTSGLDYTTVDWQDGQTHLRLVDRSKRTPHVVGVVLEERATLNALPQLRSNKVEDLMAVDPSIAAATRSDISDPSKNAAPAPSSSAAKPKKH
jgi:hypothetical protein